MSVRFYSLFTIISKHKMLTKRIYFNPQKILSQSTENSEKLPIEKDVKRSEVLYSNDAKYYYNEEYYSNEYYKKRNNKK